jgi:hypothetical protein
VSKVREGGSGHKTRKDEEDEGEPQAIAQVFARSVTFAGAVSTCKFASATHTSLSGDFNQKVLATALKLQEELLSASPSHFIITYSL